MLSSAATLRLAAVGAVVGAIFAYAVTRGASDDGDARDGLGVAQARALAAKRQAMAEEEAELEAAKAAAAAQRTAPGVDLAPPSRP